MLTACPSDSYPYIDLTGKQGTTEDRIKTFTVNSNFTHSHSEKLIKSEGNETDNQTLLDHITKLKEECPATLVISFKEESPFYIVMPKYDSDGEAFFESKKDTLFVKELYDFIILVGEQLIKLHEKKIIHKDLKFANVLKNGTKWVLADLGLSCFIEEFKIKDTCI